MKLTKGMILSIQSYKHNQLIHRVWKNTEILEIDNNTLVTAHKRAKVIEDNGRIWYTKEPAICYFYDDLWFNVIVMFKKDGIYYYCNLSSPYLYDGEAIKYIDYDLDVKVFPDGTYKILDENEYNYHLKKMEYPTEIINIVEEELQLLISKIKKQEPPFNKQYVMNHYNKYYKNKDVKNKK